MAAFGGWRWVVLLGLVAGCGASPSGNVIDSGPVDGRPMGGSGGSSGGMSGGGRGGASGGMSGGGTGGSGGIPSNACPCYNNGENLDYCAGPSLDYAANNGCELGLANVTRTSLLHCSGSIWTFVDECGSAGCHAAPAGVSDYCNTGGGGTGGRGGSGGSGGGTGGSGGSCVALNSTCSSSSQCCNSGALCQRETQTNTVCCWGKGHSCQSGSECCGTMGCPSGTCACRTPGLSCTQTSDCCSGTCSGGVCSGGTGGTGGGGTGGSGGSGGTCHTQGQTCTGTNCCGNMDCVSNICECRSRTESCQTTAECCTSDNQGLTCAKHKGQSLACCLDEGDQCGNSGECCGEMTCDGLFGLGHCVGRLPGETCDDNVARECKYGLPCTGGHCQCKGVPSPCTAGQDDRQCCQDSSQSITCALKDGTNQCCGLPGAYCGNGQCCGKMVCGAGSPGQCQCRTSGQTCESTAECCGQFMGYVCRNGTCQL